MREARKRGDIEMGDLFIWSPAWEFSGSLLALALLLWWLSR